MDGELLDLGLFSQYGREGVLLLLSDSTNATKGGFTFSEKEVRRAFEDIFAKPKERIIIRHLRVQHPPRPAGVDVARDVRPEGNIERHGAW